MPVDRPLDRALPRPARGRGQPGDRPLRARRCFCEHRRGGNRGDLRARPLRRGAMAGDRRDPVRGHGGRRLRVAHIEQFGHPQPGPGARPCRSCPLGARGRRLAVRRRRPAGVGAPATVRRPGAFLEGVRLRLLERSASRHAGGSRRRAGIRRGSTDRRPRRRLRSRRLLTRDSARRCPASPRARPRRPAGRRHRRPRRFAARRGRRRARRARRAHRGAGPAARARRSCTQPLRHLLVGADPQGRGDLRKRAPRPAGDVPRRRHPRQGPVGRGRCRQAPAHRANRRRRRPAQGTRRRDPAELALPRRQHARVHRDIDPGDNARGEGRPLHAARR